MAYDLARALHDCGHTVSLLTGLNSQAPEGVTLAEWDTDETRRAEQLASGYTGMHRDPAPDVIIDLSHKHDLSRLAPDLPILNWLVDTECDYEPPNIVVGNKWLASQVKSSRIAPLGIDVAAYPFVAKPDDYVLYAAKLHPLKGFDIAIDVAREAGVKLVMIGENLAGAALPPDVTYLGPVADNRAFQS
jgi:glycosyltransferase involved in cell wall biosynthesis